MKNCTALLEPAWRVDQLREQLENIERGVPVRFTHVGWDEYSAFLDEMGNDYYRSSYSDGEFEILMPLSIDAARAYIVSRLIQTLADELDLPIKGLDPVTIRREDLQKGLEPDRCFYFDNEPLVRGKLHLDFDIDPPPDLAVEAEVTVSIGRRLRIYAALGVPEVWRYDDGLIVCQLNEDSEYVTVERSRFFPKVPLTELVKFVKMYEQMGERELFKTFRTWVRGQIAAGWPETGAE